MVTAPPGPPSPFLPLSSAIFSLGIDQVRSSLPESVAHNDTRLSWQAAATLLPSGEKATELTADRDFHRKTCFCILRSQSRTVLSLLAVANVVPSGEYATDVTASAWLTVVGSLVPVATSQRHTEPSAAQEASVVPLGLKVMSSILA